MTYLYSQTLVRNNLSDCKQQYENYINVFSVFFDIAWVIFYDFLWFFSVIPIYNDLWNFCYLPNFGFFTRRYVSATVGRGRSAIFSFFRFFLKSKQNTISYRSYPWIIANFCTKSFIFINWCFKESRLTYDNWSVK